VVRDLPLSLFDLETDRGETTDVAAEHPEVVKRLTGIADRYRRALGDSLTGISGTENRPVGRNHAE
ncbi:MAG: arylsulfatase, partial [Planctomycetia bacterium]|nr:arylsulfatase [Planctomycetia bacterium]